MKVGVIGTGDVGQRLASAFATLGHEVMMGTREPQREDVQSWVKETGALARAGTNAEAARFGDIVVLATTWSGTENALKLAGPENVRGKLVIDVTNPLDFSQGMPPRLALGLTDSGGEQVQRWLPDAKVVKCWNIVNNGDMFRPRRDGTMLYCGNDEDAKRQVAQILADFGWKDAMDIGGIEGSRLLEPLCLLWVVTGMRLDQWDHMFKLNR